MPTRSTRAVVIPLAILFLVAAVAFPLLNIPMWTDEMATIRQIGAPPLYGEKTIPDMIARIAAENPWHAPGYFLLVYAWGHVVGWSPLALRLLSLFAGLLALAVTFNLTRRHFSVQTGIYAILTMGFGTVTLNFLHDMRTYTLIVLFVCLMIWIYEQMITRQQVRIWHYAALGLSAAGLLYLHYFAAFAVAGLGLYHLLSRFRKPHYWPVIVTLGLAGISFLPWLSVLLSGLALSVENARRGLNMGPFELTSTVLEYFANGSLALMLLLGILALRTRTKAARFVWVWLMASIVLALIASRFFPALHNVRYMFFLWPGLAVIAGLGIRQLQRLGVSPVILAGVWIMVFARQMGDEGRLRDIVGADFRPPFDNLAQQIDGYTRNTDVLMYHLPENAPNDTMHGALLYYYTHAQQLAHIALIPDTTATSDTLYETYVLEAIHDAPRVWLAYERSRRNWRIGRVTEVDLPHEGFLYCGSLPDRDQPVHVELWAHMQSRSLGDTFAFQDADEHEIALHFVQGPSLTEHGQVTFNLLWELGESIPPATYSLGLYLLDSHDQLVAQFDHGLDAGQGCLLRDMDVNSLPGGTYHLSLAVYNWQTGERLMPVGQTQEIRAFDLGSINLN